MSETHSETHGQRRSESRKVTVGGWIGTLLLSSIPVVNVILWFVWAFSARKPSRRTYAAANLLLLLIGVVLTVAAVAIFGEAISEWAKNLDIEQIRASLGIVAE